MMLTLFRPVLCEVPVLQNGGRRTLVGTATSPPLGTQVVPILRGLKVHYPLGPKLPFNRVRIRRPLRMLPRTIPVSKLLLLPGETILGTSLTTGPLLVVGFLIKICRSPSPLIVPLCALGSS